MSFKTKSGREFMKVKKAEEMISQERQNGTDTILNVIKASQQKMYPHSDTSNLDKGCAHN